MRLRRLFLVAIWISIPVLLCPQCRTMNNPAACTLLKLTDGATGREIGRACLREGDECVLTWQNSLFNLPVEEVFAAEGDRLLLRSVTFLDPHGAPPPIVRPEELEDLYHTGGPFRVEGLSRPFTRLLFRVGEIGEPKLRIGPVLFDLEKEVGFGGAVVLTVGEVS
jgi:hypothetical protein